jgi:hypothetical protein
MVTWTVRKNKQPKWRKNEFADLRQQRDYYHGIKDTENFKKYRNKLTSSIRTSKANYFSEAIKSQLYNFSVDAFKLECLMMRSATDEKWLLKLLQISSILSHFLPSHFQLKSLYWKLSFKT